MPGLGLQAEWQGEGIAACPSVGLLTTCELTFWEMTFLEIEILRVNFLGFNFLGVDILKQRF